MKTKSLFKKLANRYLERIPTYVPGPLVNDIVALRGLRPDQIVRPSSNENPLGPPPMAVKAVRDSARILSLYPDSQASELRMEISRWLADSVNADNIVVGAGSSETMSFIVRAFSKPGDQVICIHPSFVMHREVAAADGRKPVVVKLAPEAFELDANRLKRTITSKTRLIFIARPNNPTSRLVPLEVIKEISEQANNAIVVCDEAYVEFADDYPHASAVDLVSEDSNILVTRTFSKVFGLSDLRIGYTVGPRSAIKYLAKVKPKWKWVCRLRTPLLRLLEMSYISERLLKLLGKAGSTLETNC